LHSCIWELFFAWILVALFCWWCRALLPHLEESAILEHFISVVSSHCPCLRGQRFYSLKWFFLGFCLTFDHLFEFLVRFFSFSLFSELVTCVCCQWRTGVSEDRWMVAPGCDEWLTTWCGLTLGRVL
jgi:prepilin signal peptidase PulO-like enzyme (type II secretory pathway)